ncbi:MAG: hypothetical protein F6K39_32470, partial [Okeania sp. SIO3B3]|nr:hypothetical protein [Okeania sp. SIO3B3]
MPKRADDDEDDDGTEAGQGDASHDHTTERPVEDVYGIYTDKPGAQFDTREILRCVIDAHSFDEYKADYGQSLVCGYASIAGRHVGIVANQRKLSQRAQPGGKAGPSYATAMPAVIYDDSADKAARFIMDCNQRKLPIVFVHDTTGFMVGRDSE